MQLLIQAVAIYYLSVCKFTLALPLLVLQKQNSTDLNTRPVNPVTVFPSCNAFFGRDLSIESCLNAWGKIDRLAPPQAYGPRPGFPSRPTPGVLALPVRYLSDDGLCSIDLQKDTRKMGDVVSSLLISQEARSIIDECVQYSKRGGTIHGLGNPLLLINVLTLYIGCSVPISAVYHAASRLPPGFASVVCVDRELPPARSSTRTSDYDQTIRATCSL